ncbi:hypothetical protein HOF46_02610 [Candidatus Woesearchaeota archaeon]|jgi:hypothetical protein|nr:hypothetical protein [Candidatus Woesearchaeota archaeon]
MTKTNPFKDTRKMKSLRSKRIDYIHKTERLRNIIRLLYNTPNVDGLTSTDISKKLKDTYDSKTAQPSIFNHLQELVKTGLVKKTDDRKYILNKNKLSLPKFHEILPRELFYNIVEDIASLKIEKDMSKLKEFPSTLNDLDIDISFKEVFKNIKNDKRKVIPVRKDIIVELLENEIERRMREAEIKNYYSRRLKRK